MKSDDRPHHERQWSETSSSNIHNLMGFGNANFNRTMGPSQITNFVQNSQKRDERILDLKLMLDNVTCEAKHLKLLLSLKDD